MTNKNSESDIHFAYFSPSSSTSTAYQPKNSRKKRAWTTKIDSGVAATTNSRCGVNDSFNFRSKQDKKPDSSGPKITGPCSECGKNFWSWKAFCGYIRCHPERQWRGINTASQFHAPMNDSEASTTTTKEDRECAACSLIWLMEMQMLQLNYNVTPQLQETEESMNCRFECWSCKEVSGYHQVLGGHRGSHKNVKGCFAINRSKDAKLVEHSSEQARMSKNVPVKGYLFENNN